MQELVDLINRFESLRKDNNSYKLYNDEIKAFRDGKDEAYAEILLMLKNKLIEISR